MAGIDVHDSRDGAIFRVKVAPGARKTHVKGELGGALKVAVAAPPEKGKANDALVRFLAEALGLDRRALEVVSGAGGREKAILARGAEPASVAARLQGLASQRKKEG